MPVLVALYRGHRRPLSGLGPRASVRDAALVAAEAFGITADSAAGSPAEGVRLRYRGNLLNPADSLLVLNLPNNALVEVELASSSAAPPSSGRSVNTSGVSAKPVDNNSANNIYSSSSGTVPSGASREVVAAPVATKAAQETRVTIVQRDRSSVTLPFSLSTTLQQVMESFQQDPPSGVVHTRRQYTSSEELQSTTLAVLGLSPGVPGKIQLLYDTAAVASNSLAAPALPVPSSGGDGAMDTDAIEPQHHHHHHHHQEDKDRMRASPMSVDLEEVVNESLGDAIKFVMSQNFDAATGPALIIFAKYIVNIVRNPTEEKYSSISTANGVYLKRISPLRGHDRIFKAMGFKFLDQGVWTASAPQSCSRDHWEACYRVLADAASSLGLSEEFPVLLPPVAPIVPAVPFDPFKAMVTRTAMPPGSAAATSTKVLSQKPSTAASQPSDNASSRLDELARRRRELEGDKNSVDRLTEIFFPNDASQFRLRDGEEGDGKAADPSASKDDSRLMSQYIAQKMKRGDPSEAPLMTEALRLLEKAKNEKVYNKCIVKIRFPDKVILQGYFHPRHSTKDIYDWVLGCLDRDNLAVNSNDIELYITPPKTILPAEEREGNTLYDLGMVPAVNIYCNFRTMDVTTERVTANGNESKSASNASLGWYLKVSEVTGAQLSTAPDRSDEQRRGTSFFPTGVALLPTTSARGGYTDDASNVRGTKTSNDSADPKISSEGRKPKWLKT